MQDRKEAVQIDLLFSTIQNTQLGMSVPAGLLAAIISYYLNGKALMFIGDNAVTYGAPVIEEISKTGIALLFGGNILFSHIIFGMVEALYDVLKNRGVLSYTAGAAGLISHAVFGLITVYAWRIFDGPLMGIAAAVVIHMLWNHMIIRRR